MNEFFRQLFKTPEYGWLFLILVLGVMVSFLIFALRAGREIRIGPFQIGGERKPVSPCEGYVSVSANALEKESGCPVASITDDELSIRQKLASTKANATYEFQRINLKLGKEVTIGDRTKRSMILKEIATKERKDLYGHGKEADFGLVEFRDFGSVSPSSGVYKERLCEYWLPRVDCDDAQECCVYSICTWANRCITLWAGHIDSHNGEMVVHVMWFEEA